MTIRVHHRSGLIEVPLTSGGYASVPIKSIRGASYWTTSTSIYLAGGNALEAKLDHSDVAAVFRILAGEHQQAAQLEDDTDSAPFS